MIILLDIDFMLIDLVFGKYLVLRSCCNTIIKTSVRISITLLVIPFFLYCSSYIDINITSTNFNFSSRLVIDRGSLAFFVVVVVVAFSIFVYDGFVLIISLEIPNRLNLDTREMEKCVFCDQYRLIFSKGR